MTRAIICGGEIGTSRQRDTDCPSDLHDWPEPRGYVDFFEEMSWRSRNGWHSAKCRACGKYGWRPGKLTEAHVRRPLVVTS